MKKGCERKNNGKEKGDMPIFWHIPRLSFSYYSLLLLLFNTDEFNLEDKC